jgi:hypothetical protein
MEELTGNQCNDADQLQRVRRHTRSFRLSPQDSKNEL